MLLVPMDRAEQDVEFSGVRSDFLKESVTIIALCGRWWTSDKTSLNCLQYRILPLLFDSETSIGRVVRWNSWSPLASVED